MIQKSEESSPIRLRSLIIGSILIPVNLYWLMRAEVVWVSVYSTVLSLFFNVTFCIFVLILLNVLLRRYVPRFSMNRSDLLTIYIMLSVATGIFGHDFIRILIHTIGAAHWFATPENEWSELFFGYLPKWLMVDNKSALKEYYEGNSELYSANNIRAWSFPIIAWSILLLVVLFMMLCINVIIRKQWTENEKLTYPIIQLPLEMTEKGFFRNRLFWIGFGVVGAIDLLNGLNFLFPAIPGLSLRSNLGIFFTEKPLSAIGWTPICFYPFIVGLTYFMPLDLSFSCWFFYIFWKLQLVIRTAFGFTSQSGPYLSYQSTGAWIGMGLLSLWVSRKHLVQVLRKIIGYKDSIDDSEEPMSYRNAAIGIIAGVLFILLFCYYSGMSVGVTSSLFALYFLMSIAVARMRASLGPPTHDLYDAGPDRIIVSIVSPRRLGPRNLTIISLFYWLGYDYRSHPMGHQLEGFKIAERAKMDNKGIVSAIMIAVVVGIFASFWVFLHVCYKQGDQNFGATWTGWAAFYHLQTWLNNPTFVDYSLIKQAGYGLGFTFFLMLIRKLFFQFPFHPVGYAVAGSWTMSWMWFSIFIGWLVKSMILKFGGIKTHQTATPLFFGMILGQHIVGSLWTLSSEIFQRRMYGFFP
ncbi:MAG: hypothetical protein QG641_8 [Candidatus Poribacteria bacterium]|nr:hypothetical protein [Candidatus Poribacteria bacterium]